MTDRYIDYWMAYGLTIPGWLMQRTEIDSDAKVVFGAIATHAQAEDYPTLDLLAALALQTGLSVVQVKTAVDVLQKQSLIIIDPDQSVRLPEHPWADAIYYEK